MARSGEEKRRRILDPVDRVTEVIFGLLMAMTFVGSLSVATAGREEARTMLIAAFGCNLAWGLADAVIYLLRTWTERTRNRTLLRSLQAEAGPGDLAGCDFHDHHANRRPGATPVGVARPRRGDPSGGTGPAESSRWEAPRPAAPAR